MKKYFFSVFTLNGIPLGVKHVNLKDHNLKSVIFFS